jgi:hypothetical protein
VVKRKKVLAFISEEKGENKGDESVHNYDIA